MLTKKKKKKRIENLFGGQRKKLKLMADQN